VDDGFREVDALVDTPGDGWQLLDVPLNILRAGKFRSEPGWLPGRKCSALQVAPAIDPDIPARYRLSLDDLLVYIPG
jgi:hypothetical protein